MTEQDRIREMNRYPHVETGFCPRCGEWYSRTQLRLPAAPPMAQTWGTVFSNVAQSAQGGQQMLPPALPGAPPNIAYGIGGISSRAGGIWPWDNDGNCKF